MTDHAWLLHLAQTFIAAVALWITISKRMDARFQTRDDRITEVEHKVAAHHTDNVKVLARHEERLLEIQQGRERRELVIAQHGESIVRLDAQHAETMRLLVDIKGDIDRVIAKQDTLMDTMASVMLKIGK